MTGAGGRNVAYDPTVVADLVVASEPHWTLGDRLSALRVLLPADPGPTVLAVEPGLAVGLRGVLPEATVIDATTPTDQLPVPASAELVVVDERIFDIDAARGYLRDGGVLAVLGREGPYVVYPASARPEIIWRHGWPVQLGHDPVAWLRRRAGLLVRRSVPRLRLEGPLGSSLADEVLADVGEHTAGPGRLVGIVTAGRTILRMRCEGGELAVRLRLLDQDRVVDTSAVVAAEVPGIAELLPRVVAQGSTRGHPWTAMEWAPGRAGRWRWPWADSTVAWTTAEATINLLAAHSTGSTSPGWAARWCATADLLPQDLRDHWAEAMSVLDEGLPTAWCHGDLWPGNILRTGRPSSWTGTTRRRDAPAGLDRLLVPALRDAGHPDSARPRTSWDWSTTSMAWRRLVAGRPGPTGTARTGSPWRWPPSSSTCATGRCSTSIPASWIAIDKTSGADVPPDVRRAGPAERPSARGVEETGRPDRRGALWLATNGVVVKTSRPSSC